MKPEWTKAQKHRLRELAALAHERDLAAALRALEGEFQRWHAGQINAHDLSQAIHRFHDGTARELYSTYEYANAEFAVSHALHRGLITEAEAGAEIVAALRSYLGFFRDL